MGGEVQHRFDAVFADETAGQFHVAAVALHQFAVEHGLAKAGGEIIEDDDRISGGAQLPDYMAADITGAAGHQYGFTRRHCCCFLCLAQIRRKNSIFVVLSLVRLW